MSDVCTCLTTGLAGCDYHGHGYAPNRPGPMDTGKHDYLFDVTLTATVRVKAERIADAEALLAEAQAVETAVRLDGAARSCRGTITEISVNAPTDPDVYDFVPVEVDGEDVSSFDEPHECDRCRAWYDESSGDGYCGLCPSCADKGSEPVA